MPKKANQSTDWNFVVKPTRMHLPDGTPSSLFANVRVDTKQVLGPISEKGYGLLQNWDFISTVRTALQGLGLNDYQENILVANDGRRLYATYAFDNRIRSLHKVNDQVGLVLRFANSFDGSLSAQAELMAKILRCLNGATVEEGKFALSQRHNAKINLQFVQKVIAAAVNDFDRAIAVFDALAGIAISDEQGIQILKHLNVADTVRAAIQGLWLNPNFAESRQRNLYTLYDSATEFLRDYEKNRFELSAKMNRHILRTLVRGLDPMGLADLLKPVIPVEAQVVAMTEMPIVPVPAPTLG